MKKSLLLALTGIFVTVVVAGCAQPSSQESLPTQPETEQVVPTQETAPDTAPVAEVASSKQANLETSVVTWHAKKVGGQHYGTVKLQDGTVDYDANSKLVGGTFTIDMNTITVDDLEETNKMHDAVLNHLRSDDFFSVETNPTSTFTISSAKELTPTTYEITGNLTIKGMTNPVTFVATLDEQGNFSAPITIDRTLWDIKFRSLKFFSDVADNAIEDTVTFDVVLNLQ